MGGIPLQNDGEFIFTDIAGTGCFNWGTVVSATSTVLTVNPANGPMDTSFPAQKWVWGLPSIVIIGGTGLGQMAQIASVTANTVTLENPFAVVPDSTSMFVFYLPNYSVTLYKNTAVKGSQGFAIFWCGYDVAVLDNTSVNVEGILVSGSNQVYGGGFAFCPIFFTRVARNNLVGVSEASNTVQIVAAGARQLGGYYGLTIYAMDVFKNSIVGAGITSPTNLVQGGDYCGIAVSGQPLSGVYDGTPSVACHLAWGNDLNNLPQGFTYTKGATGLTAMNNSIGPDVKIALVNSATHKTVDGMGPYGVATNTVWIDKHRMA